jgi:tektin-3
MAATAYFRQPASARVRSIATPMTPDLSARFGTVADRTLSRAMSRSYTNLDSASRNGNGKANKNASNWTSLHWDTDSIERINLPSRAPGVNRSKAPGQELVHAMPYYNTAREEIYHRYSLKDWDVSNSSYFSLSDKERAQAEILRGDAWRTVKLAEQRTRFRQSEATRKLKHRLEQIEIWKDQLLREAYLNQSETELVQEHLRIVELALSHTEKPLHIAEECLAHREKRYDIDLVKDDVEVALVKEIALIKRCQEKMLKMIERAKVQIKMNRAAQHALELDMKDKTHAQRVDDRVYQMKNNSADLGYFPGIETVDNTLSIPESWAKFTQENINRSQKCRASSEKLRGDMDTLLRACANEMWCQFNVVNNALAARVQDVTDARNKLQSHLNKTMQEIFDVEKTIQLLKKAIADKEAPLKVAQSRLNERTSRLNVELCNDPAMKILQQEVMEIRDSVRSLKDQLRTAEVAHARLSKTRSVLETNIAVKENSSSIDQKFCLGMRKTFPMDPRSGPVFSMPITG